jgi:hypothetical protein
LRASCYCVSGGAVWCQQRGGMSLLTLCLRQSWRSTTASAHQTTSVTNMHLGRRRLTTMTAPTTSVASLALTIVLLTTTGVLLADGQQCGSVVCGARCVGPECGWNSTDATCVAAGVEVTTPSEYVARPPFALNLPQNAPHFASPSASCLLRVGSAFASHGTCTLSTYTATLAHMHACSGLISVHGTVTNTPHMVPTPLPACGRPKLHSLFYCGPPPTCLPVCSPAHATSKINHK